MPNYKDKIAEFENNFSTVIDKSVRDLSMAFDNLYFDKNAKEIPPTIKLAETLLSSEHNIPTKMQIHYDIANAYHDLRMIEGVYSERYLEKELYHLRCALDMYETNYYDADSNNAEVKVAQYIAMRSYTNLGNAYRALGRYIVAIDCFQDALLISDDFAMASLNLSFLLFRYAPLQIKRYEQSYFHHACYYYYKQTERCKTNLEDQDYLEGLKYNISLFDSTYVENYLDKPLELPLFQVDNQDEADYRNYLLLFRLFLDPCLEILSDHCFAVDSINLPFEAPYSDREKEFIGLFNQIKQEYNWARYLWYKTSTEDTNEHYSDRELDLVETGDSSDHSLRESMLRTAFKAAYSLFDRIGYFINQYFAVGLTDTKVSFKNIWKEKLIDGNAQKSNAGVIYKNLNTFAQANSDNVDFIRKYLTLTKCDLFFADKAIFVEGASERLLLPDMIEKCETAGVFGSCKYPLSAQYYALVEIGGAYAHKFIPFVEFLGVPCLILTDLDSVAEQTNKDGKVVNKSVVVSLGKTTSNETIKWWVRKNKDLPENDTSKIDLTEIVAMTQDDKTRGKCHIEFQTTENGLCGRSLEEAIRNVNRKHYNLGKKISDKKLEFKGKSKTDFALDLIYGCSDYCVPGYIQSGLTWLNNQKVLE